MKIPGTRRLLSVILMLAGCTGLLAVFWLLPYMERPFDGEWMARHSELAQWEYTQDFIHHFSWRHDDCFQVGRYGGKEWAEWIFKRIPNEADPDGCGSGHKISALESITNFSPHVVQRSWSKELPLWQAWWAQNRDKTQDQWIVDGFATVGVGIHNPPVKEDWPSLLKVLSTFVNPKMGKPAQDGDRVQPKYLYFNAFRCLRDSGFNPVEYALEAEITPEIKAGLLAYRRLEPVGSWDSPPGRLFAAGDFNYAEAIPRVLEPSFRWGWGSASALACIGGIWLWRRTPAPAVIPAR